MTHDYPYANFINNNTNSAYDGTKIEHYPYANFINSNTNSAYDGTKIEHYPYANLINSNTNSAYDGTKIEQFTRYMLLTLPGRPNPTNNATAGTDLHGYTGHIRDTVQE